MSFEQLNGTSEKRSPLTPERGGLQDGRRVFDEMRRLLDARSAILDQEVLGQIRKKYPEYAGKKPEIESFEYHNLDIRFVGVQHTVETLAFFREEIEDQIADADFIVLEGSIETSGTAVSAGQMHDRNIVLPDVTIDMQYPKYEIDTNSGIAFFYEMENLAKKYQKQIVNLDPFTDRRFLQSLVNENGAYGEQLKRLDEEIQSISKIVANAANNTVIGSLGAGTALGIKEIVSQLNPNHEGAEGASRLSRRKFLKRAGALVAGAALGQVVQNKAEENDQVIDFGPDPKQRWAQYNLTDFRDVSIATGLDRMSESFKQKVKVAVIYGSYHKNGVRRYLENSALRTAKQVLYKPFQEIAPPELTAYRYEMNPDIVSGEATLREVPEQHWGQWKETVRAKIPT